MRFKQRKIVKRIFSIVISLAIVVGLTSYIGEINEVYAANSHLLSNSAKKAGSCINYEISLDGAERSSRNSAGSYSAKCPEVITFLDRNKNINVAYYDGEKLFIQKYKNDMSLDEILEIESDYPKFGNVICDEEGYYYAVWGQDDSDNSNCVTMCISKYDSKGILVKGLALHGKETVPWGGEDMGTRYPFRSGNCSITIQNGIAAVNYARQMYNGHQSNMVIYADTSTMERTSGVTVYSSHSFDQRIYRLPDNRFVVLNQGDAYPRSFNVSIVGFTYTGGTINWDYPLMDYDNFHFREGSNRGYGYNETFAQLGGMAIMNNGMIFLGSSERLLSAVPKETGYMGYDCARDLFLQVFSLNAGGYTLKKDGESRTVQGTKPASANTDLFLTGEEADEGVIWLTAYDDAHYVANPHIVSLDGNKAIVLWEKRAYSDYYWNEDVSSVETYYAVIDGSGRVVVDTTRIYDCLLAADTDPVVKNGKVYWATNDSYGSYIHCLDPLTSKDIVYPTGVSLSKKSLTINKGETFDIAATVSPSDASYKTVIWSSDNENIASVDAKGRITAVDAGTTKIKATINGYTSSCDVTVRVPLKNISISESNVALKAGEIKWLSLVYDPYNTTDSRDADWSSSDDKIVTVDNDGIIKAIGNGNAKITAKVGEMTSVCSVTVEGYSAELTLGSERIKLPEGGTTYITYTLKTYDGTSATLEWSSSDTKVATVDSFGTIKAIGPGTATITAKYGDVEASCIVTVEKNESNKEENDTNKGSNTNGNDNRDADTDNTGNTEDLTEEDNAGSPYRIDGLNCAWNYSGGKYYWYENGIKQGTFYDPAGVVGDGTVRGREIYDSVSDGWYWLDSVYNGAKAVGKEVWMPYIYQDEDTWNEEVKRNVAYESDEGMGECVLVAIRNKSGKWVRYDENGKMLKGWITIDGSLAVLYPDQKGNTYYYDNRTGLMAKGLVTIGGAEHFFNEVSGVLEW